MSRLRIRHESLYTYPRPVQFGVWRLLMRPLDTHAIRIIDASLETPPARVAWTYDAYGNCVCHLQPNGPADHLKVVNNLLVERFPAPIYGVGVSAPPSTLPIAYGAFDRRVLGLSSSRTRSMTTRSTATGWRRGPRGGTSRRWSS